jgi:hypothetical protein
MTPLAASTHLTFPTGVSTYSVKSFPRLPSLSIYLASQSCFFIPAEFFS